MNNNYTNRWLLSSRYITILNKHLHTARDLWYTDIRGMPQGNYPTLSLHGWGQREISLMLSNGFRVFAIVESVQTDFLGNFWTTTSNKENTADIYRGKNSTCITSSVTEVKKKLSVKSNGTENCLDCADPYLSTTRVLVQSN